jgi:hypothetical protein
MTDVVYKEEGYDATRQAYTIVEYSGPTAIYVFKGYPKGDNFICYPFKSLRKGERREKMPIPMREVKKK